MGSRITALLGLSNPALPQPPASAPVPNQPDPEDMSVGELQARLNRAREDLAETQRLLSETQARIDAAERRRIPQGAVLVIQGLAQTHTVEDEAEVPGSPETTAGEPSRPQLRHMRRSSEGSAQRLRPTAHNGSSLEMQARMIGGLLT